MSDAVDNAAVFVYCVCESYKESVSDHMPVTCPVSHVMATYLLPWLMCYPFRRTAGWKPPMPTKQAWT